MGQDRGKARNRKPLLAAVSVALLAIVLFPVRENWRDRPRDAFPLSYYPMFSFARGDVVRVEHLFEVDFKGIRNIVPHKMVAPGGFNQVRKQIAAMASSKEGAQLLCEHVARQYAVLQTQLGVGRGTVEILVVRGAYRLPPFYEGRVESAAESILHRCPVNADANDEEASP